MLFLFQLFKNWPVTPQGPWPSPKPFPSTIPEAQPVVEDAIPAEEQDPVMLTKLRLRKLTTLLSYLEKAGESGEDEALGFYGFTKSVIRAVATGHIENARLGERLQDPCGFNLTCLIDRVFHQHLPFNGTPPACVPCCFSLLQPHCAQMMTVITTLVLALISSLRGSVEQTGKAVTGNVRPVSSSLVRQCSTRSFVLFSNDSDATIYPGRAQSAYGPEIDHNCNGIYGVDSDVSAAVIELAIDWDLTVHSVPLDRARHMRRSSALVPSSVG
jgi:hypothetical protein